MRSLWFYILKINYCFYLGKLKTVNYLYVMYRVLSEVYLFSVDEYIMILSGNLFILYIQCIVHL